MPLTLEEKEEIKELRLNGYGYGSIAKRLDVKRDQVRDFCKTRAGYIAISREQKCKECKECGHEFISKTTTQIYCSDKCRERAHGQELKPKSNCINCGLIIVTKRAGTKYCSDECLKEYKVKHKSFNNVCIVCNTEFSTTNKNKKYCSGTCVGKERLTRNADMHETVDCQHCGKEFTVRKSRSAKYCSLQCSYKYKRKNHYQFSKDLLDKHHGQIVAIEPYRGSDELINCMCVNCKNVIERKANEFIGEHGKGCNVCNVGSLGENEVEEYLISKGFEYKRQYYFDDLKLVKHLLFDFAVVDGDEVKLLIEYDGKQHFEPIESWGGEKEFKRIQESDRLKNEYAKEHNIPLIRIKYIYKDVKKELGRKIDIIFNQ